jgi:hypothetical protein
MPRTLRCGAACLAVVMFGLAMIAPARAQELRILDSSGLGKVRIGMSVAGAERVLGVRLRSLVSAYGRGCWLAVRADGIDPEVSFMVENGRITRVDVAPPQAEMRQRIVTAKRIGIGSTQADVENAYGNTAQTTLAPYGHSDGDRWVTVGSTRTSGIVLSISGGKVVSLWAGRRGSIAYTEACS